MIFGLLTMHRCQSRQIWRLIATAASASKAGYHLAQRSDVVVDFILQSIRDNATSIDRCNLCVACSMGLTWEYGLQTLVEESLGDLRSVDMVTSLYPFMLVASSCENHAFEWISFLLSTYGMVLLH